MNAYEWVDQYLRENGTTRQALSLEAGKGRKYVANWMNSGEIHQAVKTLHPIVNFPESILKAAENAKQERTRRASSKMAHGRRKFSFNPKPWPLTVAEMKAANHPLHRKWA